MTKKRLLIVAHAPSANTRALLKAVARGTRAAAAESAAVETLSPFQAGPDDVSRAQAIMPGTPENLGCMSGALKDFFDRSHCSCLGRAQGLPYALFVRAGPDGTGTMRGVTTIATGLRWQLRHEPLVCRGPFQDAFVA